ncbi:group III truncated hemoglobin [Hymenobacter sp. BT770]|uniref:group III truncated hemoglobin n=1 Tax=Hymenobacter sp. BT770 TaxID=2886942 RepID=UPI001D11F22A|nr:group III truncated hemoglobin [Hymenobacter sp. BT770]MCC3154915.1 group III truncated hemoglobin [Hymenobacter sp. BT770]MDO3417335.1 group III truncated hemoglobin [Hymenobacter sp. BT770]
MATLLPDLSTEADIVKLVDTFYARVNEDALLRPVFNDVAQVDWATHLPTMYDFWSSVLLGTSRYKGRPFAKHFPLPINSAHFQQWLALFNASVDELFAGPKATDAKARAQSIGAMFEHRMTPNPLSLL